MKLSCKLCIVGICALIGIGALSIRQVSAADKWEGPTEGPRAQTDKKITFISQDLRNGGITAAYRGFFTASQELGWSLLLVDGKSDAPTIRHAFMEAIRSHQDAIVVGGFDTDEFADVVAEARRAQIVLAGWHAAAEPGPTKNLFTNIATASSEVARMAADYVINSGNGNIGVVIFNDDHFSVANAKTQRMKEIVGKCDHCKVLSVENIPISDADKEIPLAVPRLNNLYGKAWTHSLAINDVYFDAMNIPLTAIHRTDIQNISAGDGSSIAIGRIKSGLSQQIATIAEPTDLQGWQLADELNRAFAHVAPSGYITKPILITTQFLKQGGLRDSDAHSVYREAYKEIWQK
ncbi:MAG TPA: substrate-binding domain-containing protein [Burkholderiaceae bacterium]|jgi:ribose transport system substrate-binding protein|nr:substrate-binding domain-containing protein [Burkholderiaceae bacterium]